MPWAQAIADEDQRRMDQERKESERQAKTAAGQQRSEPASDAKPRRRKAIAGQIQIADRLRREADGAIDSAEIKASEAFSAALASQPDDITPMVATAQTEIAGISASLRINPAAPASIVKTCGIEQPADQIASDIRLAISAARQIAEKPTAPEIEPEIDVDEIAFRAFLEAERREQAFWSGLERMAERAFAAALNPPEKRRSRDVSSDKPDVETLSRHATIFRAIKISQKRTPCPTYPKSSPSPKRPRC